MARDAIDEARDDAAEGAATEYDEPIARWDDPLKFLPVIFVLGCIFFLYYVYVFWHCIPMLQLEDKESVVDDDARRRATIELVLVHILTGLVLTCYGMCMSMSPGTVAADDPRWDYDPPATVHADLPTITLQERKRTGDRRHCKWCGKYKPDRCHHCRICRVCVLKMDHHCPWIYNCVGFANYKLFFLLIVYAMLDVHLIIWTMAESLIDALTAKDVPFAEMFVLLFGETVAFFFAVLLTFFLGFHIWLMFQAMTTIEFCEKALPKDETEGRDYDSSIYTLGCWGNITAVLGENPLFWLVPCSPPAGDGCDFVKDTSRAARKQKSAHFEDGGYYGSNASLPAYAGAPGDTEGAFGLYASHGGAHNFNY